MLFCLLRLADVIAALVVIRILLQFIVQAVGLMVLRKRQPDLPRPFRMWLYPLPALLAIAGFLFILVARKNFLREIRYAVVILVARSGNLLRALVATWRVALLRPPGGWRPRDDGSVVTATGHALPATRQRRRPNLDATGLPFCRRTSLTPDGHERSMAASRLAPASSRPRRRSRDLSPCRNSAPFPSFPLRRPRRRSMLGPLHEPLFRTLWIAAVVSYTGTWMQNVGAGWLMTSLTMSPLMVGLVQAAGSIAVFLVVLPAGAIADVVDRRKLLLFTQTWMVVAAAALGVLTLAGKVTSVRCCCCSPC